jgi:hypothetical protein
MLVGNTGLHHGIFVGPHGIEDQVGRSLLESLHNNDNWVIWKTKDDKWTHELKKGGFHQLLSLENSGMLGEIPANAPREAQHDTKTTLMAPQQNFGKDSYTIDLAGPEKTYWLGTESGLLGAFLFDVDSGHLMLHHSRWARVFSI